MVLRVESFTTLDLPHKASYLRNAWNPNRCLSFLDSVLSSVKSIFDREKLNGDSVLLLHWMPGDNGVSFDISKDIEDQFLPDWYKQSFT